MKSAAMRRNKSALQMKSSLCSDEIAAAMGGFHSTENAVFDFIRRRRISSRSDFIVRQSFAARFHYLRGVL